MGHMDFYPGGGSSQNGCGLFGPDGKPGGLCSHARSHLYFLHSIREIHYSADYTSFYLKQRWKPSTYSVRLDTLERIWTGTYKASRHGSKRAWTVHQPSWRNLKQFLKDFFTTAVVPFTHGLNRGVIWSYPHICLETALLQMISLF